MVADDRGRERRRLNLAFGQNIRRVRLEAGLSQEKLAELAELDRTFVNQIEKGTRSPTLMTIVALARALDTAPHQLVRVMEIGL